MNLHFISPTKNDTREQTDGKPKPTFSYFSGHETRKHESSRTSDGPSYNTSLTYAQEI